MSTEPKDGNEDRAPHPFDYVSKDAIQDLWGIGYTIVKRARHPDPFHVPPEMVPQGRSYQWMHLVEDKFWIQSGWAAVQASRHDGYFMPFGHVGEIEVGGLGLFEKAKFEVDKERAEQGKDVLKPLEDWVSKFGQFTGGARITGFTNKDETVITNIDMGGGVDTSVHIPEKKTVELATAIPKEMLPYMGAIFTERDRLTDELVQFDRSLKPGEIADKFYAAVDADKSLPWWPTLHAILLPIAIENIRKSLKGDDHE